MAWCRRPRVLRSACLDLCGGEGGPSLRRRAVPTVITVRAPVELDAVGVGERSGCPDGVTMGTPTRERE